MTGADHESSRVGEGGFEPPTACPQSRCATAAPLPGPATSVNEIPAPRRDFERSARRSPRTAGTCRGSDRPARIPHGALRRRLPMSHRPPPPRRGVHGGRRVRRISHGTRASFGPPTTHRPCRARSRWSSMTAVGAYVVARWASSSSATWHLCSSADSASLRRRWRAPGGSGIPSQRRLRRDQQDARERD